MSILPAGASLNIEITSIEQSSKTYRIKDNKIAGFCDGIEALKQAIYLILCIERYEYLIYSWNYGNELKGVIGMDKDMAESEFKRRIREALIQDDRIDSVDNFIFEYEKDSVLVKFTVFSIYGEFNIEKAVKAI